MEIDTWLAVCLMTILGSMLLLRLFLWFQDFMKELRYLNKEIGRTFGREQEHWKRQKKRLLRSLIPFVKYRH